MAKEITLTHVNGLRQTSYLGWSWTSFFFGGIPALFRGDFLGFLVWLPITIALIVFTMGIGNIVFWFVWAALYNRWHARRLVERGYQVTSAAIPLDVARARVNG